MKGRSWLRNVLLWANDQGNPAAAAGGLAFVKRVVPPLGLTALLWFCALDLICADTLDAATATRKTACRD